MNFRRPASASRENSLPLRTLAVSLAPAGRIGAGNAGSERGGREVLPPMHRAACRPRVDHVSSQALRCIEDNAPQTQHFWISRDTLWQEYCAISSYFVLPYIFTLYLLYINSTLITNRKNAIKCGTQQRETFKTNIHQQVQWIRDF